MPTFIFNTVLSWFLRNNAIVLKHILHFLMRFQTSRELISVSKNIKFLQWFIPFLREVYQLSYITGYTRDIVIGENSVKYFNNLIAHLRINSDIPRALVSSNESDIKFLGEIFTNNRFQYVVSKEYEDYITWHLINRIEIEYFAANLNMVVTVGNYQTHNIGKAVRSQIGTNKPLLTFEIWNHINKPLPIQVAIPTSLCDGSEFVKTTTVYIQKRQATLLDKNIQINHIIKDTKFIQMQDKKDLVRDILSIFNNSFECFLSRTDDLITQAFALDSMTICLNNLNSWIYNNEFDYEQLNQASMMSGMAINHTQFGIINALCVAIRKVYNLPINNIKPIVLMSILKFQFNNPSIFTTLVKCAKGIGYNCENDEQTVILFLNEIISFYKRLNIQPKIILPPDVSFSRSSVKKILKYTLYDYPTLFSNIQIDKKSIKKIIISIFTNDNFEIKK